MPVRKNGQVNLAEVHTQYFGIVFQGFGIAPGVE